MAADPRSAAARDIGQIVPVTDSERSVYPVFQDFPVVFDPVKRNTFQPPEACWIGGNPGPQAGKQQNLDSRHGVFAEIRAWLHGNSRLVSDFNQNLIVIRNDFAQVLLLRAWWIRTAMQLNRDNSGDLQGNRRHRAGTPCEVSFIDSAGKRVFVQGVDVAANYELPTTNFGQFTFTLGWNHFFTWKTEPVAGLGTARFPRRLQHGTLPLAPGAIPFNKGFLRLEWEYKLGPGNLDFVAQGNYVGDFEDDPQFTT